MSCQCNYSFSNNSGRSCVSVSDTSIITQKRIWNQVRTASSIYSMNLSSLTSAADRLASGTNWNQRSDRVLAATQPAIHPTHGNSLHSTLTSNRPGAATPGGSGVDVKHDSYARYLNRKKAGNLKTQTTTAVPIQGNKTGMVGLLANSINCCPA